MKKISKLIKIFSRFFYLNIFIRTRVTPATEHEPILKKINYNFLIDAGYNKGQFSILSKGLNKNIPILAFEPLRSESSRNVYLLNQFSDIELISTALGNENCDTYINIYSRRDSSSIFQSKNLTNLFKITFLKKQKIEIKKLDDFIHKFNFFDNILLKVDVQGYERHLLEGGKKSLTFIRWILIELSYSELYEGQPLADEIVEYLETNQFKIRYIYNKIEKNNNLVQADYLFEKEQ